MPAISRPLLIALIAAVVALVGFYATQGARNASESADAPIAPVVPAEPAPAPDEAERQPSAVAKADGASAQRSADRAAAQRRADRAAAQRRADEAAAVRRRARAERLGMPPAVARALDQRKTVVLYFRGSDSADDRATARAVASLRGNRGVVVFSDRLGRLGRYRAVVGDLGISQAPAVVIVDRSRSARVVQGYVDPATLAQDVADSR